MATNAYLTYHDGKLEIPEQLREELRLREGTRLRIAYSSARQIIITSGDEADPAPSEEWRSLRGVLAHVEQDLNAMLEAERVQENERDASWS